MQIFCISTVVAVTILAALAGRVTAEEPIKQTPLEISPETTYVDGPVRDDGLIDYVAATNAMLSEGVTPENNAFAEIAHLLGPDAWSSEAYRDQLFEQLGVEPIAAEQAFVSFEDYAKAREDQPPWNERVDIEDEQEHNRPWRFHEDQPKRWEVEWARAREGPWSANDAPLVAQWLAKQTPHLDRLADISKRPHFWMPQIREDPDDQLVAILLPGLGHMRMLAFALQVRAYDRLDRGDIAGAMDDALTLKRLARGPTQQVTLVEHLVGGSIAAIGNQVISRVAGHPELTEAQTRHLSGELLAVHGRFPFERAIDKGERFTMLDLLQRLPNQIGDVLGEPGMWGLEVADPAAVEAAVHRMFGRNRALRRANARFNQVVKALKLPNRIERRARFDKLGIGSGEAFRIAQRRLAELMEKAPPQHTSAAVTDALTDVLLSIFTAAIVAVADTFDRIRMLEQLEHVALAIGGYRAERGEYPETLDALVPRWLDEVPPDWFTEADHPIRYGVEAKRVVIYSVGPNGADDGGDEREDVVMQWPR